MQSITFTCETITPMFMAGADGTTPELRAPSIKGALRFWWRAMNGHLSLENLKKYEGEIFGDTSKRSKIIIIVREQPSNENIERNSLLPHKNSSFTNSYKIKTQFHVELKLLNTIQLNNDTSFNFDALKNLFVLVCTLGGFGKRSRRGLGSVKITATLKGGDLTPSPYTMPTTLTEIQALLGNRFQVNGSMISASNGILNYPYIKTIEIGAEDLNMTTKIIKDSHFVKEIEYDRAKEVATKRNDYKDFFNKKTQKYESKLNISKYSNFEEAIGAGTPRFASPIYVSVIGGKSIITTFCHVPPKGISRREHETLQTDYKDKLKTVNNDK